MTRLLEWKFNQKKVEKEDWEWEVFYKDGKSLKRYGDDGRYYQFSEVRDGVKIFKIIIKGKEYIFDLKDKEKPICFYRNYLLDNGNKKISNLVFGIEGKIYCYYMGDDFKLLISTNDL